MNACGWSVDVLSEAGTTPTQLTVRTIKTDRHKQSKELPITTLSHPLQLCANGHQCILLRWVNDSGTIRQTALSAPTPSNETTQSATESPWQILAECKSVLNQQRDSSTLRTDKYLSLRTPDPFILILVWLSVSEVNPILHCLATGNNLCVCVCACARWNRTGKLFNRSFHSDTDSDYTWCVTGRYSTSFIFCSDKDI